MNNYRYQLQPYTGPASRTRCPQCGKPREFARYIDQETGDLVADNVGRCNREEHCGYHLTPREYFEKNGSLYTTSYVAKHPAPKPLPVEYLPIDLVGQSMRAYDRNNLTKFLTSLFGEDVAQALIIKYLIGSSKHWQGATAFWQIDEEERVHQCKIMLFDPVTGRRSRNDDLAYRYSEKRASFLPDKGNGDKIFYAGKRLLNNPQAHLQQCFFGEHLLSEYPEARAAIVESEKTAIIASVFRPEIIWLSTGGKHGARWIDPIVCGVLRDRTVELFPDVGAFDEWSAKAREVRKHVHCDLKVCGLLEDLATEEQVGWDLADFLVANREESGLVLTSHGYPVIWDFDG